MSLTPFVSPATRSEAFDPNATLLPSPEIAASKLLELPGVPVGEALTSCGHVLLPVAEEDIVAAVAVATRRQVGGQG